MASNLGMAANSGLLIPAYSPPAYYYIITPSYSSDLQLEKGTILPKTNVRMHMMLLSELNYSILLCYVYDYIRAWRLVQLGLSYFVNSISQDREMH